LDQKEYDSFNVKVHRSGLTREAYLRQLINGLVPSDLPPPDYFEMMKELRRISNNLNHIAIKAHFFNVPDLKKYDENFEFLKNAILEITNAVMLPRRML